MAESAHDAETLAATYTAEELYDKAQEHDVEGRSSMDKEELAEAVAEKTKPKETEKAPAKKASAKKSTSRKSSTSSGKADELLAKAAKVLNVPRHNGHESTCKGATDSSVNCTCREQRDLLREIQAQLG